MSAKRLQDYMMSEHVELKKNSLSSYMTTATKETDPYKQTVAGTRQAPSYVRHTLPEQGEDELTDDYVRRVTALYEQDRQLQKQAKANGTNARVQTQAEADARAAARKNYSYGQAAKSYNESRLEAKNAAQRLELGVIDEAEYARILGQEAKAKETYRSEGGVTNPVLTRGAMKQYGGSLVTGLGVLSAANGFTGLSPEEMPQDAEMQKYMLSQAQKNIAGENEDINAIINKGIDISESGAKEIETMKAGHGAVGKLLIDVAVQAEMMAADMAVNKVLGVESLAPLVARSYGGGAAEAISDGADYTQASLYGAASAGVEALTEKMFDGFAQIYGKGDSTKLVSYVAGKLAKTDAGRMAWIRMIEGMGEGVEEVVSDLVNPMLKSIYNGKGIISNYRELNAGDIAYDFLVGAILGYAGQAVEGITSPGMDDTQAFFSDCARNGKSFKESCKLYESMMSAYDAWTRGEYSKDGTAEDTDTAEVLPALPVEETIEGTYTEAGETVESYEEEAPASTLTAETYAETLRNATQAEATEALDEEVAEQQQTAEEVAEAQSNTAEELDAAFAPFYNGDTINSEAVTEAVGNGAVPNDVTEPSSETKLEENAETGYESTDASIAEWTDEYKSKRNEAAVETPSVAEGDSSPIAAQQGSREADGGTEASSTGYKQSAAYKAAVEYGRSGVPFSLLVDENMDTKLESVKSLTPAQRQEAYLEGKNSSDAEARKNLVSLDAQANGETGWKQGSVRSDGSVKMADLRATFNAAQNEAYDAMSAFASVTGIDIVLTKSEPDAEGFYTGVNGSFNRNTNEITIDINSGIFDGMDAPQLCKYLALRTFGHELTHFTEKWSPVMYNQYREAVFEHMRANGTDVDELISRKQEQTGRSYEEASREVVAEESADIIPESSFAERLAKKNRKLFASFLSKLKEFVSKLKKSFASMVRGGSMNDALKTEVNGALRYAENIVEMYDSLVTDAVERYQKANAVEDRRVRLDDLLAKAENIAEDESGKRQLSKLVEDAYERGKRKKPVTVDSLLANIGDAVEDNTGSEQLAGLVAAAYQRGQKAAETTETAEETAPARTPEEEALYKETFEGATPEWAMGALEKAGFTRWQKGNHDRLYINAKELGLEIKYGKKAGQIDSATFRGENISNNYARSLKSAKTYVDVKTQEVVGENDALTQEAKALYMEALTAAYENKLQEMNSTTEEAAPQEASVSKLPKATDSEADFNAAWGVNESAIPAATEALASGAQESTGDEPVSAEDRTLSEIREKLQTEGTYEGHGVKLWIGYDAGANTFALKMWNAERFTSVTSSNGRISTQYFNTHSEAVDRAVEEMRPFVMLANQQAASTPQTQENASAAEEKTNPKSRFSNKNKTEKESINNGETTGRQEDSGEAVRTDHMGAVPVSEPDGEGAPRLVDEHEAGDVQRAGGREEAAPTDSGTGEGSGRHGGEDDSAGNASGRSGGDSESGVPVLSEGSEPVSGEEAIARKDEQVSTVSPKGDNFSIGESLDLPNGDKARFSANIDAIRTMHRINAEGRAATSEEQAIMSKYVGWGGLANAFGHYYSSGEKGRNKFKPNAEWEKQFNELWDLVDEGIITEAELTSMSDSTRNAHYTSIEVVKAMYTGLKQLGFSGGRIIEPSCGSGNFAGAMPADMKAGIKRFVMVDIDRVTGGIAKLLYPNYDVRIEGYQNTVLPDDYLDVAIGNVPFGNASFVDKRYPHFLTSSLHNYFFIKTLDKVRPGGIVMFITSSYTMDAATKSSVREYIASRADLLGAIRLPNTAFLENAKTSVVTDIIILKKRSSDTGYAGEPFITTKNIYNSKLGFYVAENEYFQAHPEMILGTPDKGTMYGGRNEVTYNPIKDGRSLRQQIEDAFSTITRKMDYLTPTAPEKVAVKVSTKGKERTGLYTAKDGKLFRNDGGEITLGKKDQQRLLGILSVKDAYNALVESISIGSGKVSEFRKSLNAVYDSFVATYGYLNDPANASRLIDDPDRYSILSLEKNYTPSVGSKDKPGYSPSKAEKSAIFFKDTFNAAKTITSAKDVTDAVSISMNVKGYLDIDYISRLIGQDTDSVKTSLLSRREAFLEKDGSLTPRTQYLSGNVRAKLKEAKELAAVEEAYNANVEELEAVLPEWVTPEHITVQLGARWIPVKIYSDFISDTFNDASSYVFIDDGGEYKVRSMAKGGPKDTSVWGTLDIGGLEIFERIMNHRQIKVSYKDGEKTYVDEKATALAREYEQKLRNEFQRWLFEGKRGESITSLYNDTFNAFVTPKYDGSNLTITGIAAGISLYEHQSNAIQRILQSGGNTLLAHAVGAGKTLEMCGAIMKLRELGVVKKPVIVAPKNLTAQWKNEFLKFFPAAKILAADDKNFDVGHRRMFANMAKNNDFDAIIMSYENFEKLPMAENYYSGFYDSLIMDAIDESNDFKIARDGKGMNAKELSKKKASLQELIDKLTQKAKDTDIPTLEEIGIDGVFVDEAHNFKNLWYITNMTNVSGLGNSKGAQRSLDMLAKIRYIQSMNGGRGIVFATATPVMNSMSEMYIMQRYLQPDRLDQMGLKTFDAWASQFGQVVIRTERDPTGQKFREKESFSNFINVGQLQQLFRGFADVLTEVPGLKLPKRREVVVECPMNSFQKAYMIELGNRAQATKGHARGKKGEDNMLKITGDGRKVAYSQHLIDPSLPYEEGNKAFRCCDEVVRVYNETTGITVRDPSTGEDIVVNGTQIVFVDMGTPKGSDKTDSGKSSEDDNDPEDAESEKLYSAMKARLIQNGVKESEIAFIHDAKTDKKKEQLFADMNSGKVRVLLGSTAKMGVGMNAQRLVVALHHVDVPWRPGDLDQREGRAIRQGNLFDEVRIFKYVALGSSDSFMWDKISWKSAMIKQVMSGTYAGDSVEDADEVTISADEMSAIATGNPLMKVLYDKQTALEKERTLVNAKYSQRNSDNSLLERNMESLRNAEADRDKALSLQKTIKENSDGEFSIKINGKVYSEKSKAGIAIDTVISSLKLDTSGELPVVFRGVTARYNAHMESRGAVVNIFYGQESFPYSKSGIGTLTSLSNIAARYEDGSKVKLYEDLVTKYRENIATLEKSIAAPIDSSKIVLLQEEIDKIKAQIEAGSGSGVYDSKEQYQLRSKSYTDEELLSLAVAEMEEAALSAEERAQKYEEEHPGKKAPVSITRDMLTGEEIEALHIYENKLASVAFLQEQRNEQGRIYKENTFVKGGNREEAAAAKNRMEVLDTQLSRAKDELLEMQNKPLLRKVLSKARGAVEKMGKEDAKEALDKLRKQAAERDRKARYRKQAEANVKTIMGWLTHPDSKKAYAHVPKSIRSGVVAFMEAIDMSSKQLLNGGEATVKDRRYLKSLRELRRTVEAYAGTEDYLSFVDIPESLMPMLDELIEAAEAYTAGSEGNSFTVNTMNSDQLKALNELLVNLKRIIQRANSLHQNAVFAHVDEVAQSTIKELSSVKNSEAGTAQRLNSFFNFDIVRPTRIFKRFGKGGESIAKELMQGQDRLAYNAKAIVDFAESTFSGKEVREWSCSQIIVQLGGEEVKMTETQLMCLYELYKDPDGKRKLTGTGAGGGLRVATYEQDGTGRFGFRKKVQVADEGRSRITDSELEEAFNELSSRQIEVADAIQSFIAKQGGDWLNEISMIRFGEIAAIVGEHYFPNSTDPTLLGMTEDAERKFTSPYAMLNKNFTKSRKDNASTRLIVYDIFDVLIDHMGQMAEYNAFALPVLDTLKWLNYSEVNDSGEVTASVKGSLNAAFGQKGNAKPGSTADGIAVQFVKDILRSINNATQNAVDADAIYNKLLHRGNKAKVAFNGRVASQQPLAIIRAGEYLKAGEILRGVKELASQPKLLRATIAEMEAHSGIATWKVSLGYYDTNISKGLAAQVKQDPSFMEKLDEIGMKGAETADTVTWAAMWNACKAAVQNRGIKEGDTGYWDSVTELFETIIYDTQVVDSALTKASFMRSNATVNRTLSSFMGESVATYSMLEDAYYRFRTDAKRMGTAAAFAKHRNKIFRAFAIYGISALAEALAAGLYDAWRDDDDYQTFLQKFAEHFKDNFKDAINPLEMIPVVNKLWEAACYIAYKAKLSGEYAYKPSDFLTDTLDGIVGTIESLLRSNKNYTGYRTVYYLLNAFSDATGVAAASFMREVSDFWNNTFGAFNPELKLKTYDAGAKKDIQKAFKDGWLGEEDAAKKLVEDANLSIDDASELAAAWATQQEFSKLDLSESEAKGYNRIRDKGIDIKTYISFRDAVKDMTGEDENGDGKTDSGSVRNKVVAYIAKLPLLPYQKDTLYLSEGYAESKLEDTPWH